MRNGKIYLVCLMMWFSHFFMGCNNTSKKGFYDYSSYSDLVRVPLIEPYEIISADQGNTFTFMLPFDKINKLYYTDQITPTDSIGINDNFIVLYTKGMNLGSNKTQAWFLIDIKNKDEVAFTKHEEFQEFIHSKKIGTIKLYDCKSIYSVFASKGSLPTEWPVTK